MKRLTSENAGEPQASASWNAIEHRLSLHDYAFQDIVRDRLARDGADTLCWAMLSLLELFDPAPSARGRAEEALAFGQATACRVCEDRDAPLVLLATAALWAETDIDHAAGFLLQRIDQIRHCSLSRKVLHRMLAIAGRREALLNSTSCAIMHARPDRSLDDHLYADYAYALAATGHFEQAEAVSRQTLDLMPGDRWTVHTLVHALAELDRPQEGLDILGAITLGPGPDPVDSHLFWHRAHLMRAVGQLEGAAAIVDRYVAQAGQTTAADLAEAERLLNDLSGDGFDVAILAARIAMMSWRTRPSLEVGHAELRLLDRRRHDDARLQALALMERTRSSERMAGRASGVRSMH